MKTLPVRTTMFLVLVSLVAGSSGLEAQRRRQVTTFAENTDYDGRFSFTFARLRFAARVDMFGNPGDLQWNHDYPRAEYNFAEILAEVTMINPYPGGSNIIEVGDPGLFQYPVAYMAEPGFLTLTEDESENLRNYLLRGGFIIFDDFAGRQWNNFQARMRDVLPDGQLVRLDETHEIFDAFFRIESLEMNHPYFGVASEFWGMFEDNDPSKRLLLIANYNNDIGEAWEYSGTGFIPIDFSNDAYKLGVNYIIYSMTH